jgi:tRNA isopentenyl-2-thiomethyl-A-37 hydroxylase MiaE
MSAQQTAALWDDIEHLRVRYYAQVRQASQAFWDSRPTDAQIVDWLKEQVWSEREGAKLHAYPVLQMADKLDPADIQTLMRQGADEARHCELVWACLKARGGDIEGFVPDPGWKAVFDRCFAIAERRDPVYFMTLFYLSPFSEGAAVATAELALEATDGTARQDIADAYRKILPDESRHWGDGMAMLRRYATTPDEVRRARDLLAESAAGLNMLGTLEGRAAGKTAAEIGA